MVRPACRYLGGERLMSEGDKLFVIVCLFNALICIVAILLILL